MTSLAARALFPLSLFALAAAPAALAQTAPAAQAETAPAAASLPPQDLIDWNPLSLVFGEISVEYERALAPSASLVLGPKFLVFSGAGATDGTSSYGVGLDLSVHFFPGGEALHGFWLGPQLSLIYEHLTAGDVNANGVGVGGYGVVGYTFLPTEHFAISLGLGAGYATAGASATGSDGQSVTAYGSGFSLTGRLAIGYAW